jgi:ATP-binding cassette, subfamily F, member 3
MVHASGISKHYGSKVLYTKGSFQINREEKLGLVGSNGSGKTTILKILAREEGVEEGSVSIFDKLVIGDFSQNLGKMISQTALVRKLSRPIHAFLWSLGYSRMKV